MRGVSAAFDHPRHFPELDGLRGFLALSVVLLHYGINALVQRASHGAVPGFLFQLSVDFFFVLSGFVLSLAARSGAPKLGPFAIKRLFRLLPVYWACMALMFVVTRGLSTSVPYFNINDQPWLTDVFLGSAFGGGEPIVVPAWSVAWELALPIFAVCSSRWLGAVARRGAHVLLPVACVGMATAGYGVALGAHLYPIRAALGLAAGHLLFVLFDHRHAVTRLRDTPTLAWVAAMLAIMLGAGTLPLLAILFPWCAIGAVMAGTSGTTMLSSRPIAWLGRISFTLYLVHIPALVAAEALLGPALSPGAKAAALSASMIAADLLTRSVELPMMTAGRRLARQGISRAP